MKRSISAILFCLFLMTVTASAVNKANFSGSWKMDKSKSEGLPPGMEQAMTIKQEGDTVNHETTVITDQGDQSVATTYVLDGKEVEYPVKRAIGEGKGKRTARWNADGNGFEVAEEETVTTQNGPVVLKFARKWTMAPDGTLVIELAVDGPNGKQQTKRIFVKQ